MVTDTFCVLTSVFRSERKRETGCWKMRSLITLVNTQNVFGSERKRETGCGKMRCLIKLVNTQNVSVTKIADSSSIQRAGTKYGLRIQFLALVVMIHELWLNA